MKRLTQIFLFLLLAGSISCGRHTPEHTTLQLAPEAFADFLDVNHKIVELVAFENPGEGFLSYIRKVDVVDGHYFLINHAGDFFELLKFDKDGSFKKRIGGIGRGPSEYTSVSDFAINVNPGHLFLLNASNSILKYSFEGDFFGEIQSEIMSSSFELAGNDRFYRYHGKTENFEKQVLTVSDHHGAIEKVLHTTHYTSGQIDETNFFRHQDAVYFREVFDNKIYRLMKSEAIPVVEFDFGKYNFKPEFSGMDIFSIYEEMVEKGSFLVFVKAMIADEWIYACFTNEKDQVGYHILYNALSGKYKNFRTRENSGVQNAHLLDEAGNLGFFIPGVSLKELFDADQLKTYGVAPEDLTDDATWLVWLGF